MRRTAEQTKQLRHQIVKLLTEDGLTQADIAREVDLTNQGVQTHIYWLLKNGWIEKKSVPVKWAQKYFEGTLYRGEK